jgi:hypothetical protein
MEAWQIDFFYYFRRWGSIPRLKLEISAMPRASAPKSQFVFQKIIFIMNLVISSGINAVKYSVE